MQYNGFTCLSKKKKEHRRNAAKELARHLTSASHSSHYHFRNLQQENKERQVMRSCFEWFDCSVWRRERACGDGTSRRRFRFDIMPRTTSSAGAGELLKSLNLPGPRGAFGPWKSFGWVECNESGEGSPGRDTIGGWKTFGFIYKPFLHCSCYFFVSSSHLLAADQQFNFWKIEVLAYRCSKHV